MSLGQTRLWKQIGSQTLQKHSTTNSYQNTPKDDHKQQKKQYQQNLYFGQNFAVNNLHDISLSQIRSNYMSQINSFGPKSHVCYHEEDLQTMLNQLDQHHEQFIRNSNQQKTKQNKHSCKCRNSYLKVCKFFKSVFLNLKKQLTELEKTIKTQLAKSKTYHVSFQNYLNNLQEIYFKNLICSNKKISQQKLQIQFFKNLNQQLNKKQLQYLNKIQQYKKQQNNQYHKFVNQLSTVNLQKQKVILQNTQLSQKIFDLQQKLLGFDIQVQKKAQEIIQQMYHKFSDQGGLKKSISIQLFETKETKGFKNKSIKKNMNNRFLTLPTEDNQDNQIQLRNFHESAQQAYNKRASLFAMNQEQEQITYPMSAKIQKQKEYQISGCSSLKKLFSKNLSKTYPQSYRKSSGICSLKQSTHLHNFYVNSTVNQNKNYRTQRFQPNSTGEIYRKSNPILQKKTPQINQISQKLNKIKSKIQNQIYNITVLKNKQ